MYWPGLQYGRYTSGGGDKGKKIRSPTYAYYASSAVGGDRGAATDISIQAEEILRMKKCLNEILVKHTGQSIERVEADVDRDFYMSSPEAKTYGLIDEVIESLREIKR